MINYNMGFKPKPFFIFYLLLYATYWCVLAMKLYFALIVFSRYSSLILNLKIEGSQKAQLENGLRMNLADLSKRYHGLGRWERRCMSGSLSSSASYRFMLRLLILFKGIVVVVKDRE